MAIRERIDINETTRIYLPDNTDVWQLRYKDDKGKWVTRSTKERDMVRAISSVENIIRSNVPNVIDVCYAWEKLQPKNRKTRDYVNALHKWIVPYIGHCKIDDITQKDISDMYTNSIGYFETTKGRKPSKSTLLNWNAALNAVFDYAIINGLVHHTQLPKLSVKNGTRPKRRVAFTDEQIKTLINSEFFNHKSKNLKTIRIRFCLRYYIEFLLYSGIRHGTESDGIAIDDIRSEFTANGDYFCYVTIRKGKTTLHTGDRTTVLKYDGVDAWKKLMFIGSKDKGKNRRLLGDISTERLGSAFKNLLEFEGMYRPDLSLYSLRHTYITKELLKGTPPAVIASQCGTSIEMLDKHYGHLTAKLAASQLVR
ncbi:tyrosine-type recombinase/integrase [Photobacterium swingsii]|uniref:tyrosine-type recombinase/integrase n=1 Tax=Photobacterium swingsii TaxID=680026 RepID=UPI00352FA338